MKLTDWMNITGGRVTEGSEFGYHCYGDRAYYLSFWNNKHGNAEVSTSVVYDRNTFDIYEADVYDGARNQMYTWRHPEYIEAYKNEEKQYCASWHQDWPNIELESPDDFIEKATAIINGFDYDTRIKIPLNIDNDELFSLMTMAHERDITLNELVETVVRERLGLVDVSDKEETNGIELSGTEAFVAALEELSRKQTKFTKNDEGFLGVWNTVRDLKIIDYDYGQFTSVISYVYDSPAYTYEAVWFNGDITGAPDEIVRTKKD